MRFRLRTLLIVLALGPPVLAGVWWKLSPLFGYPLLVNALVVLWLSMVFSLGVAAWVMTTASNT
jgi:hypothetical protein